MGDGDWLAFDADFGDGGVRDVLLQHSGGAQGAFSALVQVRLDSPTAPVLGSAAVSHTGGWEAFRATPFNVTDVTGRHRVYITVESGVPDDVLRIASLRFRRIAPSVEDMRRLDGKTVAFLLTDGFEDSELTSPWNTVVEAGGTAHLIAPEQGTVTGKKGHVQDVDRVVSDVDPSTYDALVLPGGTGNADALRLDEDAVAFTRHFGREAKPVAVICHGAWILTDADVLDGRRMTSFPSLRTDLRNAGATWVDEEVVVDGWLVSSRTPADLAAFTREMTEAIAG